ncbi:MAG: cytochrome c3 family protein [Deltaproteobacteria bacterium]|nr:cytochrome c3 family protein [Deltaproteobacteria bacterium]MDQ3299743.1 cytochrome c family protein [Myxococcota bacterium]
MRKLVIVMATLVVACTPTRGRDEPLPPLDPTRLSHERHAQIPCGGCHRSTVTSAGAVSERPGGDHKPCDDGACHKQEFLSPPGLFCRVCHDPITITPLAAPLRPYPSDDLWQSLPPVFSHRRHMNATRMERQVGFHVACVDCHTRDGARVTPDHAACARCHAAEVALPNGPRMEDCASCHKPGARPRKRMRLIRDDLHFSHERHQTDRKNQPIRCEACHTSTTQARGYDDHAAPRIESCVGCHDDIDRTPYGMRMRICETCHKARVSSVTTLAPRNHLPASERPLDHTIAFRRDHAEVAGRDAARCATCHTQMSGNSRQACDECHQTMLPSDHRITWRELDHGAEAAADRNRCASCHVVEFCSACHAQRPRSHGLRGTFREEHGRLARINVRACLTCHVADYPGYATDQIVSCAECHEVPQDLRSRR